MVKINRSYGLDRALTDVFPRPVIAARAPTTADRNHPIGRPWVRTSTNQSWILTSVVSGSATWSLSSPGASDVDTINGLAPVAGDILIDGGTNLTDSNAGNTVTLNLDAAITLATSVTSPIYTSAAGADTNINSVAGQDVIIKMGDNAAANKVSFTDSDDAEVANIDSNGAFTTTGLTFTGLLTANASATINTAGTALNLATDNSGDAVNIGTGTTIRAIGIGNAGAVAHTIAIGAAAAGDISVNAGAGTLLLDSSGVLEINSSAGVIGIGNDAIAQNINVGTGASARTITIGNVTGATGIAINSGTGSIALASTGAGDITINSDDTLLLDADGVLELNSSAGVIGIGNDADANNINVGTGAAARTLSLGNVTGATSVVVDVGTGQASFGASATVHATTIGSQTGNSGTVIQAGTGSLDLLGIAGQISIDGDTRIRINSSGGTIDIGSDADANNINVGTGAAARTLSLGNVTGATSVVVDVGTGNADFGVSATAHTTTIGSVTGASALVLQSGTGRTTMTGTVKEVTSEFSTRSGDFITFTQSPMGQSNADTGVAPTGAGGDVNLLTFQEGIVMEQFMIGTQTIICPRMDATGLLMSLDLTSTDGWEWNYGAARANSRHSYTIGTAAAFYMELRFTLADVSGCEPFLFGFRKTQANDAAFGNYTDFVGYGVNDGIAPGDCVIQTQLNTGGLVSTDTNDAFADAATHTLQVLVSSAGVVTFTFDGGAPTATQAFTFDNGDVVHPFIHNLFNAGAPGNIHGQWMKIGFQA